MDGELRRLLVHVGDRANVQLVNQLAVIRMRGHRGVGCQGLDGEAALEGCLPKGAKTVAVDEVFLLKENIGASRFGTRDVVVQEWIRVLLDGV